MPGEVHQDEGEREGELEVASSSSESPESELGSPPGVEVVRAIHPCEFQPPCQCEHVRVELNLVIPGEEYPRCFECAKPLRNQGFMTGGKLEGGSRDDGGGKDSGGTPRPAGRPVKESEEEKETGRDSRPPQTPQSLERDTDT